MSPFLPLKTLMNNVKNDIPNYNDSEIPAKDDPKFIEAHIETLKVNLLNCHNELQMIYGQLNAAKDYIKHLESENLKLNIKLTVNGIETEDYNEESI
jgi:hypothetical protein